MSDINSLQNDDMDDTQSIESLIEAADLGEDIGNPFKNKEQEDISSNDSNQDNEKMNKSEENADNNDNMKKEMYEEDKYIISKAIFTLEALNTIVFIV